MTTYDQGRRAASTTSAWPVSSRRPCTRSPPTARRIGACAAWPPRPASPRAACIAASGSSGGSRVAPRDSSCPTILFSSPAHRHGWRALHLIPTYSSWLHQVERAFALITDKAIRSRSNGPPLSTRSLRNCIDVSHVSAGQDTGLGGLESNPPRGSAVAKPLSRWRLVAGCWSQPARSGRGARNTARCCNNRKL